MKVNAQVDAATSDGNALLPKPGALLFRRSATGLDRAVGADDAVLGQAVESITAEQAGDSAMMPGVAGSFGNLAVGAHLARWDRQYRGLDCLISLQTFIMPRGGAPAAFREKTIHPHIQSIRASEMLCKV